MSDVKPVAVKATAVLACVVLPSSVANSNQTDESEGVAASVLARTNTRNGRAPHSNSGSVGGIEI